jgi:hypothetical protein
MGSGRALERSQNSHSVLPYRSKSEGMPTGGVTGTSPSSVTDSSKFARGDTTNKSVGIILG